MKNEVVILTGPSGSGKDTIMQWAHEGNKDIYIAEGGTTRSPRKYLSQEKVNELLDKYIELDEYTITEIFNHLPDMYKISTWDKDMVIEHFTKHKNDLIYIRNITDFSKQCELIHADFVLNAMIKINQETDYMYWVTTDDTDFEEIKQKAFINIVHGNKYITTFSCIINMAKKGICLLNIIPSVWEKHVKRLKELDPELTFKFVYFDLDEPTRRERMLKGRGDNLAFIEDRLAYDKTMWNDAAKNNQFHPFVIDTKLSRETVLEKFLKCIL